MSNPSGALWQATSPPTPGPLLRRIGAFCIDLVLLAPLLAGLGFVWARLFQIELPPERLPLFDYLVQLATGQDPLVPGGLLFLLGVIVLYFIVGPLLFGATPGLYWMGLTLLDREGRPIGAAAAMVRSLGTVISTAYFFLGFLWILFDPFGRGFHDRIAGTWVVRRNAR